MTRHRRIMKDYRLYLFKESNHRGPIPSQTNNQHNGCVFDDDLTTKKLICFTHILFSSHHFLVPTVSYRIVSYLYRLVVCDNLRPNN